MTIGIIGSGNVGGALGTRWAKTGRQVLFSSRNPQSQEMQELVRKAGPNASATSVAEAARADVIVLATPYLATREALRSAGNLTGKILVDAINPLRSLDGLDIGTTTSFGEQVAAWAPGAHVVKAFNTVGFNVMTNPEFNGGRALLFYCGDDAEAKRTVHTLAEAIGFDPKDAGPLTQSRVLEPFAMLWISLALKQGYGLEFAFQLLQR